MREESEKAQAIVERHDDHVFVLHKLSRVIVVTLAEEARAAVDSHHYRVTMMVLGIPTFIACWSVHIQVQAIFGRARHTEKAGRLRTVVGELGRIAQPAQGRRRLRWLPAQIFDRRSRVRDAEELVHRVRPHTHDRASIGGSDDVIGTGIGGWTHHCAQHGDKPDNQSQK